MSALDGWIDICRAGTWRDMAGRAVPLDADRLDRIVAAHAAADPAPVVVGHPETDAPAYAWIDGLRRVGDRLQARLRDIAPPFREAVEAGRYAGRSIALEGDRLRHVGFLGGRAPAVPGLAPTRFSSAPETVVAFERCDDEAPRHAAALSAREGVDGTHDDGGTGSRKDPCPPHPDPLRASGRTGDEDGASLVPLSAPEERGGDGAPDADSADTGDDRSDLAAGHEEDRAAEQPGACDASARRPQGAGDERDRAARSGPAGATAPARREARSQASGASARRLREIEQDRAAEQPGASARRLRETEEDRAARSGPAGATAPARREARSQASGASARRLREIEQDRAAEQSGASARRLRDIEEREAQLLAREAALAGDESRRSADAALAPHVESGRVLPAERAGLAALLAALIQEDGDGSDGSGDAACRTIAFSAADGSEVRARPAAILQRFLAGLPSRVDYRTLAGGPVPGAPGAPGSLDHVGEDSERIAAEARALIAAEAARGMTLSPAEAVDRARARRGLGNGGGR